MSREHIESAQCWCEPRVVLTSGGTVFVHDEPDERAPDAVVAEAVALAEERR